SQNRVDANASVSKKLEQHRNAGAVCTSCHVQMDPIGLGLENYDENGLWRTRYAKGDTVISDGTLGTSNFKDAASLIDVIEADPRFVRCIVAKAWTYLNGASPTNKEASLNNQFADGKGALQSPGLRDLMVRTVTDPAFLVRQDGSL
ncbi:DUF1588 domain-containing protein, partial [bacterium]